MQTGNATIEQRLTRLEDIEQIRQLISKYAHYLDDGYNPEGIASTFTEDGIWLIENEAIKGREAIKQRCKKLPEIIFWSMHTLSTATIDITLNGLAKCRFYGQALQTMKAGPLDEKDAYIILSVYTTTCIKIEDKWYFELVQANTQQAALWSDGWIKSPPLMSFFKIE